MNDPKAGASPPAALSRLRLLVVLGLVGAWLLRWATVQTATGVALEHGPARTGAVGALTLVVAWGLGVSALLGRDARGWVRSVVVTEIVVALLVCLGLGLRPPALDAPTGTVFVFAGLGLLAVLQLAVSGGAGAFAREVATLRGACALVSAVLLGVAGAGWAAGLACFLGAAALLVGRASAAGSARRGVEALSFLVALLLLVAPWMPAGPATGPVERTGVYEGLYLWVLLTVVLVLLAVLSFPFRREAG